MRRMILVKGMVAALAVAVMAGPASADLREYCDSYARDVAHRKTNGSADALVGTSGAARIGGLIDHRAGAAKGTIIGGGSTILGAGATGDRYKRAYTNAFERCVDNYEGQRVREATAETKATETKATETEATETEATETKVTETKVTETKAVEAKADVNKVAETKVAANEAADKACARKYRSWDSQKGKYKSYSGKWKPCRL